MTRKGSHSAYSSSNGGTEMGEDENHNYWMSEANDAAREDELDGEENNGFCDNGLDDEEDEIELVVQGKDIIVKESLLVRHSRYFAHIFGSISKDEETVVLKRGRLDGEDDVTREQEEEPLTLISYATMRTIVDFLQTGVLKVGEQNVKSLLIASDMLVIGSVETRCFNFLKATLNTSNCVRHFVLADAKSSWKNLSSHCGLFIQRNFDKLRHLTQIYQHTTAEQFGRLLADDCLNVEREEDVLDSVLEWVSYDSESRLRHLPYLMKFVQWPLMRDRRVLEDALSRNPLISSSPECLEMVNGALHYHDLPYAEKVEYWRGLDRPTRWPKLLAAAAYADTMIECFDFDERRWQVLTEKPTATFGAEMTYLKGKMYMVGGVQTKQVDQYDIERSSWVTHFPSLTQFRVAHGVTANDNQLFVMGGSAKASADFGPGLNEMEILSVEETKEGLEKPRWSLVSSMEVGRSYLASTVSGDKTKIYAVGGCLMEKRSSAEFYDLKHQVWQSIAPTLTKRDSLGLVTFDGGQIYAVGGYNNIENTYLNTVERYDPRKDAWFRVRPMVQGRRSPGVVAYRGKIYVVGGMGEKSDLKSVEVYDPILNKWSRLQQSMKEICGTI